MSFQNYLDNWQESEEVAPPGKMPMQDSSRSATDRKQSIFQDAPDSDSDILGRAVPVYQRGEVVVDNEDGDARAGSMD